MKKENTMSPIEEILTNPFLITPICSWIIAQILKMIIHTVVYRKFDIKRLFGDGGMPSGHSATVASLAVMAALVYGLGSFQFALSSIFALVVCHDAMGVRHEAGKQATVLNELIKSIKEDGITDVTLKEFLGHTPMQVLAGIILGILNALLLGSIIL